MPSTWWRASQNEHENWLAMNAGESAEAERWMGENMPLWRLGAARRILPARVVVAP
jgi:hypothetical protein